MSPNDTFHTLGLAFVALGGIAGALVLLYELTWPTLKAALEEATTPESHDKRNNDAQY